MDFFETLLSGATLSENLRFLLLKDGLAEQSKRQDNLSIVTNGL